MKYDKTVPANIHRDPVDGDISKAIVGSTVYCGLPGVDYGKVYDELKRHYLRDLNAREFWQRLAAGSKSF